MQRVERGRMRAVSCGIVGCAVIFSLSGCSLLGLDQFVFPGCEDACAALNARDGITDPSACERWSCQANECVFGGRDADGDGAVAIACGGDDCDDASALAEPGNAEACNGVDDDCNGLVDDTVVAPEAGIVVLEATGPLAWASAAPTSEGLGVAYQDDATRFVAIADTSADTPATLTGSATPAGTDPLAVATLAMGCPTATPRSLGLRACPPATCSGSFTCVTGPAGSFCEEPVVGTPIPGGCTTHAECDDGSDCNGIETCEPTSPGSDARGCRPATVICPAEQCDEEADLCFPPGLGSCNFVDLPMGLADDDLFVASPVSNCGGGRALRSGSFDTTEPSLVLALRGDARLVPEYPIVGSSDGACTDSGVSDASLAVLRASPERRLPQALSAWIGCDGEGCSGPVTLLGHWLENGVVGETSVRWVSGSDDGVPRALTDEALAVHASPTASGWVTAWAGSSGVRAAVIDALPLPSPNCTGSETPCVEIAPPHATTLPTARARRQTPALTLSAPVDIASGSATDVAVAVFSTEGAGTHALFVWAEADAVVAQRATLEGRTITLDGAPLRTAAAGARELTVAHLPSGFASIGTSVGGTAVTEANAGGFVVAWSSAAGTFALRIADVTGAPIGSVVRLAEISHGDLAPFTGEDGRVHLFGAAGRSLTVFPSICGPS